MINELWNLYRKNKDVELRNKLVEQNLPLVTLISASLIKALELPVNYRLLEFGDIFCFGVFGLIQAVERFDPSLNFKFTTYARHRIKGSIIDELRKLDYLSRSVRTKLTKIKNDLKFLETSSGITLEPAEAQSLFNLTTFETNQIFSKNSIVSWDVIKDWENLDTVKIIRTF